MTGFVDKLFIRKLLSTFRLRGGNRRRTWLVRRRRLRHRRRLVLLLLLLFLSLWVSAVLWLHAGNGRTTIQLVRHPWLLFLLWRLPAVFLQRFTCCWCSTWRT